jgi:hypothetical protein
MVIGQNGMVIGQNGMVIRQNEITQKYFHLETFVPILTTLFQWL